MFTNNYLQIIKTNPVYNETGSYGYSIITGLNVKDTSGTIRTKIMSSQESSDTHYAFKYANYFFSSLYFQGTYSVMGSSSSYDYTKPLFVSLENRSDPISAADYSMTTTYLSRTSVTFSNGVLSVTFNNTGSSPVTINTLCIGGRYLYTQSTSSCYILLAEFDLGTQTIPAGSSKTFRVTRQNLSA